MIRIIFIISTLFVSFLFEGCSLFTENKPVLLEEETLFEKGRYYYLSSLNFNLDQTKTNIAINKFNQLIKEYPDSSKIKEAYRLLNNLLKKSKKKRTIVLLILIL